MVEVNIKVMLMAVTLNLFIAMMTKILVIMTGLTIVNGLKFTVDKNLLLRIKLTFKSVEYKIFKCKNM